MWVLSKLKGMEVKEGTLLACSGQMQQVLSLKL